MFSVRQLRSAGRSFWAVLLVLLMGMRLLTPAGFMPSFAGGQVAIVACPEAGPMLMPTASRSGEHRHDSSGEHNPCPYADASGMGSILPELTSFIVLALAGMALLLGQSFRFVDRQRAHERPPLRGPPIPA